MWVSSFGNGMKVGYLNSTGISEPANRNQVAIVYPNPFSNRVYFSFTDNDRILLKVNVYSLEGRTMISLPAVANPINTSSLNPGIYLVEFIFDNNTRVFRKIVKVGERE